jgi:L,D-peptidoglycan transpeptidase YkuD (ErfK/YbiS/YcfS/YnhG family)
VASAQVVVVRSAGTTATVQACRRHQDGTYVRALGPYSGHVGYAGVAPVGAKREGDGRTPGGLFALRGGFGAGPNPGLLSGWFTVDARDVWVDDPGSSLYNTHQRTPAAGRWTSAESLAIPAYRYAQVIGYNESRRPGLGSAIFLHLDSGGATAGCVSVSESALLALLRWSRPNAVIAIS